MRTVRALPVLLIIFELSNRAFSGFAPYPADILDQFPPLEFPDLQFAGAESSLHKKLSDVETQMEAMGRAQIAMKLVTAGLAEIPVAGVALEPASDILADHLMSAVALNDLRIDLKTKIAIEEAFANHGVSHFKADVTVLKNRLEELFGSNATDGEKRLSAIPAIHTCEKILELFADETFLFWKQKLIFYPHLISFSTLYAMSATAAGTLVPYKIPALKKNMHSLQATVLKYYPPVKAERLSKITIENRQLDSEPAFSKYIDVRLHCPAMKVGSGSQKPVASCVLGAGYNPQSYAAWRKSESMYSVQDIYEWSPEIFNDTVTGQLFCGWEGCWNKLHEHYGNSIDNLTMSALKLLPFTTPPHQLPQAEQKGHRFCSMDSYGRLEYRLPNPRDPLAGILKTFGCHKGYCWSECSWGWCYTKFSRHYHDCLKDDDCCPEWRCKGPCSA